MINCDYSYARDCSECNEPVCRRDIFHSPNDWEDWEDDDWSDDDDDL